ncbi:PfaD family polyunsaturated fatty acid/polyketide biosynthesis protein [Pseudonocardia sp. ICBG1293]|uniref:PfaD family polyunsaturated fatty acid/polyketide biosynthesis protein n=1 Tax=Pseudonocardia sp. ICBG1293 TaxID=2844382 RepID=UPI001CCAC9E0|nr:PfaD family polyunsaturated fatty acid/polyketide biosynthesis protein [Pseudonocardia sp. ICBG1293]
MTSTAAGADLAEVVRRVREPVHVVVRDGGGVDAMVGDPEGLRVLGTLPPLYPEWLGDRSFGEQHGARFPYVAGEMANGIATTDMVVAMGRAGMLGFFGAAGLAPTAVEAAVHRIQEALPTGRNWGVNLIHAPQHPEWEQAMVDLLVRAAVPAVSTSAFMDLTPTVVQLAASGLRRDGDGRVVRRTHVLAKVSRPEVAEKFLSPPPRAVLEALRAAGRITAEEAELAARVPVAGDLTVEADSGGHTDNRPLVSVLPRMLALAARVAEREGLGRPVRVGVAGGLGTPHGIAAAFAAGAAYVVTGSVNQTCLEAGISADAKELLAGADVADVMMAPASDMFELGVKVQVLRRGTMFGPRANLLYQVYRDHPSLEAVPPVERERLERSVFRAGLDEVWSRTREYWMRRDPAEVTRAQTDPKHRMALVFRWYLGRASWWAIEGETDRRADYQLWCGPATGAFNDWVRGTFLADPARREVVQVARNLLEGAAVLTRAQQLRSYGVPVPPSAFGFTPRRLA